MNPFPTDITHTISTVPDGNMAMRFGDEVEVLENRKNWLAKSHIKVEQTCLMQTEHKAVIHEVTAANFDSNTRPVCDVLVTSESPIALMLLTADCMPVAIHDQSNHVIALGHFNRHNAPLHIATKTITYLAEKYGTKPEQLQIHIGPNISKESYRFPLPLTQPTPPDLVPYITEENGYVYVDVLQAHLDELLACGIPLKNICIDPADTATDPKYFSHYATKQLQSKPDGRFATLLMQTTT